MARRSRNRQYIVPEARAGMAQFKAEVMRQQGYAVDPRSPNDVKYAVASRIGVPLTPGYNGDLPAKAAGKVGGQIGGAMVREMVKMAQQAMSNEQSISNR